MTLATLAAVLVGVTAAAVTLAIAPPKRRLDDRVTPYAQRARLLLGRSTDTSLLFPERGKAGSAGRALDLVVRWSAERMSALVDRGDDVVLARRLRHAGERSMTPEQYRLRQFGSMLRGAVGAAALGLVVSRTAAGVLLLAGLGAIYGTARTRARTDKAIDARREQMRAELPVIAQLVAIDVQAGHPVPVAVKGLVGRCRGAAIDELADAVGWMSDGASARVAFERLAANTPEPAAARFYRVLATSDLGSNDALVQALLHAGNDLRAQRREDVERFAIRRRFLMLVPTIVAMGPVMLVLLAAPVPNLIFGGP